MRKLLFIYYILATILTSCQRNRLDVNLSAVKVPPVTIKRFEHDLFAMGTKTDVSATTRQMIDKYGIYFEGFLINILGSKGVEDTAYATQLKNFISDKDMRDAYNDCNAMYNDVSDLEQQLTETMRYFRYHFPKAHLPQVITTFTGFNYSISTADSIIAVGLEMYLGQQNKFYDLIQLPFYKRLVMRKEYIIPDIWKGWVMDTYPQETIERSNLLNAMIYNGKVLYVLDALMRDAADTLKIGFTKKQLEWCETNESNMWGFFVKNKLLFSIDNSDIVKYVGEGPFTTDFNKESPARTGVWIGWQIVRKYMDNNPDVSLQALLNEKDAQKILNKSKYKPD